MRRWMLSALVATTMGWPLDAQQADKPKSTEKQDAKQTQQAVKDARKHAKKADEQPYDAMQKADEDGKKAAKSAQKKSTAVGTSGGTMRFQTLDTNRNGIIERGEWRGDDRAFANEDWNGDGKLSGDEVVPGAKRPAGKR
jgi:hypothetical protein